MKEKSGNRLKLIKITNKEFDEIFEKIKTSKTNIANLVSISLSGFSLSGTQFEKLAEWVFSTSEDSKTPIYYSVECKISIILDYLKSRILSTIPLKIFDIYFSNLIKYFKDREPVTARDIEACVLDPCRWSNIKEISDIASKYLSELDISAGGLRYILGNIFNNHMYMTDMIKNYFKYRTYNNAYIFNLYIDGIMSTYRTKLDLSVYKMSDALDCNWESSYGR